jgi:hypothetical protein
VTGIGDAVEAQFGLAVLSPHEVIRRFDELWDEERYRPQRMFLGPGLHTTLARADDLESLVAFIHLGQQISEPRRRTLGRLKEMLALPSRFTVSLVNKDGHLLAAHVVDAQSDGILRVPYFAVSDDPLGRTAAHHYIEHLVTVAMQRNRRLIVVENPVRVDAALRTAGFWDEKGVGFVKVALPVTSDAATVATEAERLGRAFPVATSFASQIASALRAAPKGPGFARPHIDLVALERTLWPAKITDTGLPCYVVPIQPRWAKDLFDRELASGTLFGAIPQLVLNSENVYYRAARPGIVTSPARILWYVSQDKAYPGTMAVRACSYVDEVIVGSAKGLFRRFRRLGVYRWEDVHELAGDPHGELMAFRFSKTELFTNAISWDDTQALLEQHGRRRSQFQGPLEVPEACFLDFYRRGKPEVVHAA